MEKLFTENSNQKDFEWNWSHYEKEIALLCELFKLKALLKFWLEEGVPVESYKQLYFVFRAEVGDELDLQCPAPRYRRIQTSEIGRAESCGLGLVALHLV